MTPGKVTINVKVRIVSKTSSDVFVNRLARLKNMLECNLAFQLIITFNSYVIRLVEMTISCSEIVYLLLLN